MIHSLFLLVKAKKPPFSSAKLQCHYHPLETTWLIHMWLNYLLGTLLHVPLSFSLLLHLLLPLLIDMFLCRCLTYVREAVQRASTKSQLQKSHLDTLLSERVSLESRKGLSEGEWLVCMVRDQGAG